jgi:hypothetical protein
MINKEEADGFLHALDLEDSLPSTSSSQREANEFRREFLTNILKKKPNNSGETVFSNLSTELMDKRLKDSSYRFSVRGLLND